MAISTWSRRRIFQLWALALTVQCAFAAAWALAVNASYERDWAHAVPSGAVVQSDSASRARMDQLLRDSVGIVLQRRGDSIVGIELTARGDSFATALTSSLSGISIRLGLIAWALLIAGGLLFFSPLLIATVLTLMWRRARIIDAVAPGDA